MFELQLFVVKTEFTSKRRFWISRISSLPYQPHYIISIHHFCWWKRPVFTGPLWFGSGECRDPCRDPCRAHLALRADGGVVAVGAAVAAESGWAGLSHADASRAVEAGTVAWWIQPPWICPEKNIRIYNQMTIIVLFFNNDQSVIMITINQFNIVYWVITRYNNDHKDHIFHAEWS